MTKGTRLAHDWKPRPESETWCRSELRLEAHQIEWLRLKFIDYFTGPDATRPVKKDWERAFLNWAERDAWRARKIVAPAEVVRPDLLWQVRLEGWTRRKFWMDGWGPRPGQSGCEAPKRLLKELAIA